MAENDTTTTILIAEDEATHINLFERNVRRIGTPGLSVIKAHNGREAVEQLNAHFANSNASRLLMLLDLNMPVMNGFKVMEYVNRQPYRTNIQVVVLSTSDEAEDLARARQLGCDRYMIKPVSVTQLRQIIEEM